MEADKDIRTSMITRIFAAIKRRKVLKEDEGTKRDVAIEMPKSTEGEPKKRPYLLHLSIKLVRMIERLCGLWGLLVAKYPLWMTVGCLVLVSLLGLGTFNMNVVYRPYDLWVPKNSEFSQVTKWKIENFPPRFRKQVGIWKAENVLKASVIQKMWALHLAVESMVVTYENRSCTWKDVCLQFPADYSIETFNLAIQQGSDSYVCYETSLLELWGYEDSVISALTDEQIIEDINSVNTSKLYGTDTNFSSYLSGIERDGEGKISKASAVLHTWLTKVDPQAIEEGNYVLDVATGDKVDLLGVIWEKKFVKTLESQVTGEVSINIRAGYTLSEVLRISITQDVIWIIVGWILLIFYVILTIGRPFAKSNRMLPAIVGLISIALAVLASFGACSLMKIPYGTLTNVLPVLLVALGVDDMYVIVTAWDKTSRDESEQCSVERKAQLTMEHAGMAITVTSITDILAFVVGTITSLPGLRWFCIYSAVGIAVVYVLQGTLFIAAMTANQKRHKRRINFPSFSSPRFLKFFDLTSLKCKMQNSIGIWSNILMKPLVKVVVILLSVGILGFSLFNVLKMSKEFDTMWLIPKSSNLYYWYKTIEQMFPHEGEKGAVYFKGAKLPEDIPNLVNLTKTLEDLSFIDRVDGWFKGISLEELDSQYESIKELSPDEQCELLLTYIDIKYRSHFHENFNQSKNDGEHPCSRFLIEFQYSPLDSQDSKQLAMSKVREIVKETNISGYKAVWAHAFSYWETDRIILTELFQSLCIVLSVVGLISLILLASVMGSILVLVCVVATLIDVASFVHLWGLTINTITSLAFVLAVGICVDYATHIVHDFLLVEGSKDERAKSAIQQMGLAVFHGGCSTLIAFLLLAPSGSYIFISYFKILTGVSIFGLFHALVFLPVMLSLMGPDPYPSVKQENLPKVEDVSSLRLTVPSISSKEKYRYSADVSALRFYLPMDPPPYNMHLSADPPLYRKSSSLPCLAFPSSNHSKDNKSSSDTSQDNSVSDILSHSSCCTKL